MIFYFLKTFSVFYLLIYSPCDFCWQADHVMLVRPQKKVHGCTIDEYWCDVFYSPQLDCRDISSTFPDKIKHKKSLLVLALRTCCNRCNLGMELVLVFQRFQFFGSFVKAICNSFHINCCWLGIHRLSYQFNSCNFLFLKHQTLYGIKGVLFDPNRLYSSYP